MAGNLDSPDIGNFNIEDTLEMGMGNKELLSDLYDTGSANTKPEDIEEIKDEPKKKEVKTPPKPAPKAKKEEEKEDEQEEEEKEVPKKDPLKDLLSEEDEVEKKETEEEEEEGEDSEQPNTFTALSKELFKLGVFSKDEGEGDDVTISTPEEFLERFNYEKQKGANETLYNFLGQFGEDYQNAFQAIYVKGVNPKDYFGTYNNIEEFSSLDLTQESNQIAVIKKTLADQGLDPEDITTEIERLKNYGDVETVAQRYHKVLVKKEAAKLAQLEKESANRIEQQKAIKNQYLTNVQTVLQNKLKAKEFDGIPLNPKLATELQDFLVTDKYKTPSGETLTEFDRTILDLKRPENHEKKVKIALLLKILEKDPTLSTIQKAGITKRSDALFGELARQTGKSSIKTEKKTEKPSSWFS